jgi:hypothetical protein
LSPSQAPALRRRSAKPPFAARDTNDRDSPAQGREN